MSEKGWDVKSPGVPPAEAPVEKPVEPTENQSAIALLALGAVALGVLVLKQINQKKQEEAEAAHMAALAAQQAEETTNWAKLSGGSNTGVKAVPAGSSGNRSGSPLPGRE